MSKMVMVSCIVFVVVVHIIAKVGSCPAPDDDMTICRQECSIDHDCDADLKCCEQTCGRMCVEPIKKGSSFLSSSE